MNQASQTPRCFHPDLTRLTGLLEELRSDPDYAISEDEYYFLWDYGRWYLTEEEEALISKAVRRHRQNGYKGSDGDLEASKASTELIVESELLPKPEETSNSRPENEQQDPVDFNCAISYVDKVKARFDSRPEIYEEFLEILQIYQRESESIEHVYAQVVRLFDTASDLTEEFKVFLPQHTIEKLPCTSTPESSETVKEKSETCRLDTECLSCRNQEFECTQGSIPCQSSGQSCENRGLGGQVDDGEEDGASEIVGTASSPLENTLITSVFDILDELEDGLVDLRLFAQYVKTLRQSMKKGVLQPLATIKVTAKHVSNVSNQIDELGKCLKAGQLDLQEERDERVRELETAFTALKLAAEAVILDSDGLIEEAISTYLDACIIMREVENDDLFLGMPLIMTILFWRMKVLQGLPHDSPTIRIPARAYARPRSIHGSQVEPEVNLDKLELTSQESENESMPYSHEADWTIPFPDPNSSSERRISEDNMSLLSYDWVSKVDADYESIQEPKMGRLNSRLQTLRKKLCEKVLEADREEKKLWDEISKIEREQTEHLQSILRKHNEGLREVLVANEYDDLQITRTMGLLEDMTKGLHFYKPTYIRVKEKHILPETLDVFGLPWEWDERDGNYIIIKQWINEDKQETLFEHTRKLIEARKSDSGDNGTQVTA